MIGIPITSFGGTKMPFIIIGIILLVVIIWAISTSNNFKIAKIKIEEARSGIEVALTKRYDMLTKLLDVAKGYARHEMDVLTEVINLRKGMSVGEMNDAAKKMDKMSEQLNITAEAYPELRSCEVFTELQEGIIDAEAHLQAARRVYNSNVTRFNTMLEVFPSGLLGKKYTREEYFEAEEHKKSDVKMSF